MQITSDVVIVVFLPESFGCHILLLFDFGLADRTNRPVASLAKEHRAAG
jgi:hypothetical protein